MTPEEVAEEMRTMIERWADELDPPPPTKVLRVVLLVDPKHPWGNGVTTTDTAEHIAEQVRHSTFVKGEVLSVEVVEA